MVPHCPGRTHWVLAGTSIGALHPGSAVGAHKALVFLEEVASVTSEAKVTTTSVYLIIETELLASSLPGRPSKQAPLMLISMLTALEQLTVDDRALLYYRSTHGGFSSSLGNSAFQRPS